MPMNNHLKASYSLLTLVLLVAAYFLIPSAGAYAQTTAADSEKVTKLFSEAKDEAHELELDAEHMEEFTRSGLTWESHSWKINEVREHVTECGRLLAKLHDAREKASPWQQKAIDEIEPLLKELATNTQSAIDHVTSNKNRVSLRAADYEGYLAANYAVARKLAALITDYVDYGEHKAEFERLGEKLGAA